LRYYGPKKNYFRADFNEKSGFFQWNDQAKGKYFYANQSLE